ncbi:hypothetical protein B0F90DRAFT_1813107 [Multifurca ochricompacta]|uniref:Uncharacterized protein n=1 Tax=Multifurca ochricompacta TaxID=376703 RepID=A0AAD4MC88_9AGAM|nr:hypothetical protein B0F90DRAFT_1813107 [Multifurca ochricompacta]
MVFQLTRKLAITLFFYVTILLFLAGTSSANGISPNSGRRRDHVNLKRMIKIRAPAPPVARQLSLGDGLGAIGAGANPPKDISSTSPSSSTTAPTSSDSSRPSSVASSPESSSSPSSLASSSSISSVSSTSSASSVSSTSSTSSIPTTTASSTSSAPLLTSTSSTSSPSIAGNIPSTTLGGQSISVDSVTLTSHVPAASSTSADNTQIGGSSLSHTTLTILIVLAASIGGCAIIWTIIRKWKFRPSAQFEDRLEPINWQPTVHDSGLPTHRRVPSNASSFHSAGHENSGLARSDSQSGAPYSAGRNLTPLPDHDFTPGPSALAPVGGYADLARGPSPQPQMQEAPHRGPSLNRGYENYPGLPPHHQGSLALRRLTIITIQAPDIE